MSFYGLENLAARHRLENLIGPNAFAGERRQKSSSDSVNTQKCRGFIVFWKWASQALANEMSAKLFFFPSGALPAGTCFDLDVVHELCHFRQ